MPLDDTHVPGATITAADINAIAAAVNALDTGKLDTAAAAELIRDTIGAALVAGTGMTVTVDDGADSITLSSTGGGGGGGGGGWDLVINDPLTDLSGWHTTTGWVDGGAFIEQTSVASDPISYNTKVALDDVIVECEMAVTTGNGSGNARIGLAFGMNDAGAVSGAFSVNLQGNTTQTTQLDFEQASITNYGQVTLPSPVAVGTWMTLKVKKSGSWATCWLNGVFITSFQMPAWALNGQRIGFYNYNAAVKARNLKVWTPTLP